MNIGQLIIIGIGLLFGALTLYLLLTTKNTPQHWAKKRIKGGGVEKV